MSDIEAPLPRKFSVGTDVYLQNLGAGVVADITPTSIVVHFNSGARGVYDALWFRLNPRALQLYDETTNP